MRKFIGNISSASYLLQYTWPVKWAYLRATFTIEYDSLQYKLLNPAGIVADNAKIKTPSRNGSIRKSPNKTSRYSVSNNESKVVHRIKSDLRLSKKLFIIKPNFCDVPVFSGVKIWIMELVQFKYGI